MDNSSNTGFWQESFKIANWAAEHMNNRAALNVFKELGFNEATGQFNQETLKALIAAAENGDPEAIQKLHELFHWIPAGAKLNIAVNLAAVLKR